VNEEVLAIGLGVSSCGEFAKFAEDGPIDKVKIVERVHGEAEENTIADFGWVVGKTSVVVFEHGEYDLFIYFDAQLPVFCSNLKLS
jgi:hypothetical protein